MQGRIWFSGSALPLIAIYLYSKFYLNASSSFSYLTDKAPFGEHNKYPLTMENVIQKKAIMGSIFLFTFLLLVN